MEWILGPQLIGAAFVVMGYMQQLFPPEQINSWYGYRMPSAMKDQQTWNRANLYSAHLMVKLGLINLLAGFIVAFLLYRLHIKHEAIFVSLIITSAIATPVLLIIYTEKHLQKFNADSK